FLTRREAEPDDARRGDQIAQAILIWISNDPSFRVILYAGRLNDRVAHFCAMNERSHSLTIDSYLEMTVLVVANQLPNGSGANNRNWKTCLLMAHGQNKLCA